MFTKPNIRFLLCKSVFIRSMNEKWMTDVYEENNEETQFGFNLIIELNVICLSKYVV